MDILLTLITGATCAVAGVLLACWRLQSPVRDFATNLRSMLSRGDRP